MILSRLCHDRLSTVHPDLRRLVETVASVSPMEFTVAQANRTREEQYALWRESHNVDGTHNGGIWKTDKNGTPEGQTTPEGSPGTGLSNHQGGHAVDLAIIENGQAVWDHTLYQRLAAIVQGVADRLNIRIIWGGSWNTTPDWDHFELDRNFYP